MASLPVPFREEVFSPGTDYGFPADDYRQIRRDFPHVHVLWRKDPGQMEVWAVGIQSGKPHSLMKLERWQVPKLRSMLWDMHYEAMNTTPHEHAVAIKAELDEKQKRMEQSTYESMNPDAFNWNTRKSMDIHRPISGQVPDNYADVAEA